MKKQVLFWVWSFCVISLFGQDTFSIIAVDEETGEVGSAGASCITGAADFGGVIIISQIIPGRGGMNAQATICIPNRNLEAGIERMEAGDSPDEVLEYLFNNDQCFWGNQDSTNRQYGIADFDANDKARPAAFTGANCMSENGHIVGPNYAIQGNILLDTYVLDSMEARFLRSAGTLADKLMAAMQGANIPGADSRCLSDSTSSTSAFLMVYKPDDLEDEPSLLLNVLEAPAGVEPIDSLQKLFDEQIDTLVTDTLNNEDTLAFIDALIEDQIIIYPNPSIDFININTSKIIQSIEVVDLRGKRIAYDPSVRRIDITDFPAGMFWLEFKTIKDKSVRLTFIKI
jgi:uncharacterized Ntn-hydrolase superfamily protein